MQSVITGKAYVLGDNVDTDQIIPAQYLTFNPSIPEEYRQFGKYALSSVPPSQAGLPKGHVPFHTDDEFVSPYKIIVAGKNFGCGSSREHAPIALDAAGIEAVVAEFYARIFFRNSVNGGYLIPFESVGRALRPRLHRRRAVARRGRRRAAQPHHRRGVPPQAAGRGGADPGGGRRVPLRPQGGDAEGLTGAAHEFGAGRRQGRRRRPARALPRNARCWRGSAPASR